MNSSWLKPLVIVEAAAMLLLLNCSSAPAAAAHILWVQFDGSYRAPKDVGFPTCSGRIGTAAASCCVVIDDDGDDKDCYRDVDKNHVVCKNNHLAFYLSNDDDDHDRRQEEPFSNNMLWIGGKALTQHHLPPSSTTVFDSSSSSLVGNSAEAEYEGLLLGLEKAVEIVRVQNHPSAATTINKILIQGDCKTVLDQLKDSSRPRKLRSHYLRAQEWLQKLITSTRSDDNETTPTTTPSIDIIYEHIPRERNQLCDGICGLIRTTKETEALEKIVSAIDDDNNTNDMGRILNSIVGEGSIIPYSKRPPLYHKLVQKALEQADYRVVIDAGEVMEKEAKSIWSSAASKEHSNNNKQQLQALGVKYQIQGLNSLGTRKGLKLATAKERKNRFLLQQQKQQQMGSTTTTSTVVATTTESWSPKREYSTNNINDGHAKQDTTTTTRRISNNDHHDLQPIWQAWLDKFTDNKQWKQQQQQQWVELYYK